MRSNDKIPEDEMLLAEACAAAKARGLRWTMGAPFRMDVRQTNEPDLATSCCALGALHVAGCITLPRGAFAMGRKTPLGNVHAGNDRPFSFGWSTLSDADRGESLGWAFRCFMTQDESDPTTEQLIAERSGK